MNEPRECTLSDYYQLPDAPPPPNLPPPELKERLLDDEEEDDEDLLEVEDELDWTEEVERPEVNEP